MSIKKSIEREALFPRGIAYESAFCNRVDERAYLTRNIGKGVHTLLVSPRRYGKTSLIFNVKHTTEKQWIWGATDFLMASDEVWIQEAILKCVGNIIGKMLPSHKKALAKVREFISSLSPRFVISEKGPSVEFSVTTQPQQSIVEALEGLDRIAAEENQRVVIVFDEFQQLSTIENNTTLEAAIRHAAERARYTSYIFSGSNRHLLAQMFDDSSRPLYHLCDQIKLERIHFSDHQKFLQQAAKAKWGKQLDEKVIAAILKCTQCHSYYVNVLCSKLWDEDSLPDEENVLSAWRQFVLSERGRIAGDLAKLSPNQRGVLLALAHQPIAEVSGKAFLQKVRLSSASVLQAVDMLIKKDFLYRDAENILHVLDPAVGYFILQESKSS